MANIPFLNNAYFSAKVGIGTASPQKALHIEGASGASASQLLVCGPSDTVGDTAGILLRAEGGEADSALRAKGGIFFEREAANGLGKLHLCNNGSNNNDSADLTDAALTIAQTKNVGIGTVSPNAKLEILKSGTNEFPTLGTASGNVYLTDGGLWGMFMGVDSTSGTGWIQQMRNDSAVAYDISLNPVGGNVGIGTDSPGVKLDVNGQIRSNDSFLLQSGTTAIGSIRNQGGALDIRGDSTRDVSLGSVTSPQALFIEGSNGNVGIGTTSPDSKLHIADSTSPIFTFERLDTTTIANEVIGQFNFKSTDSSDTGVNASIKVIKQDLPVSTVPMAITFETGVSGTVAERMRISSAGAIKFNDYDSTNNTGTPTYLLGTDASGNIVKTNNVPGSGAGPYLPLAGGTMTGNIDFNDSVRARFGDGDDLQIVHDGSNSYIHNVDVGDLYIRQTADDKDIIFQSDDGSGGTATYLFLDGSNKRIQFNTDFITGDNNKITFGNSGDLEIFHNGTNSYIKDTGTGNLEIRSNFFKVKSTVAEDMIWAQENASVSLFHNNIVKFATTSTGISVTGDIQIDSVLLSNQENTDVDTGTETVANVAIATYTAAFFDFVIKKTTNVRSGTVYACHDGTSVVFTETSTQDLGDTSDVTLSVVISGTNMELQATTTSDDWSIKSLIRAI